MRARIWLPIVAVLAIAIVVSAGLYLRPIAALEAFELPDEIVESQPATICADVVNEGRLTFDREVAVLVDEKEIGRQRVSLRTGERARLELAIPGDLSAGEHQLALAGVREASDSFVVLTPPSFVTRALDLSPAVPRKGEAITASMLLSNEGQASGEHTVTLQVDGRSLETTSYRLEGLATVRVEMPFVVDTSGDYEVRLDDQTIALEVHDIARPANGAVLINGIKGDVGQLKVVNNFDVDCVVVLSPKGKPDSPVLAVYVRAGEEYKVRQIKDGVYDSYVVDGRDWCQHCKQFMVAATYCKWDEPMEFDTRYVSRGYNYSVWTLTLGIDSETDGDESNGTSEIRRGQFPTL